MADNTEGRYDNTKTVKENVDADFKRIKESFDKDGATAAYDKLASETQGTALSGATAEQQRQYQETMAKQLKDAGILPEISVAHALKNPNEVMDGNTVNETKLGRAQFNAKDPLSQAMYKEFGDKYQALKAANHVEPQYYGDGPPSMPMDLPVTKQQLERTLSEAKTGRDEKNALTGKQNQDKKDLAELVTNPKLFDALADKDGKIYKGSVDEFNKKFYAPGEEGEKFRAQFGDKAAQQRAAQTVETLKKKFDEPGNQDDKPGSILKENSAGILPWNWFNKGDYMTRDTLAKGLGYTKPDGSPDVQGMKDKLPKDIVVQTKPNGDIPSVTDYRSTAQNRGDGPYQVAQRMLDGQGKYFKNPDEAQRMLTDVMRDPKVWTQDKQGVPKVTAENRDDIVKAIKDREAAKAKATGQPENNDLSNWFASRYPKLDGPAAPAKPEVKPAENFSASKIISGQGSDAISRKLVEGQGLDDGARKALQRIIGDKSVTGVDLGNARTGTEVINAGNLEKIRQAVEKANNPQLKEWFNKRYPKKG